MSVSVTFEPSGISGLVAQGTYLIDAAKRMGAPLGHGCLSGKSECPDCVVSLKSGSELLSARTAIEDKLLGETEPGNTLRMLCQTKIEGHGEIVVMVSSYRPRESQSTSGVAADLQKKFGELSLKQKISALVQFEAITMTEVF